MKIKDILPFEDYIIKTNLSVEEANFKLNESISAPGKSIFSALISNYTKPYKGTLYGNKFNISRVISYRNSFLPKIEGDIFTLEGVTNVRVKMETNRTILVIWYIGVIIFSLIMFSFNPLFPAAYPKNSLPAISFGLKLMPVIFLITPLAAFKTESRKSKKFLSALLGEIKPEST